MAGTPKSADEWVDEMAQQLQQGNTLVPTVNAILAQGRREERKKWCEFISKYPPECTCHIDDTQCGHVHLTRLLEAD
jgi:hypothetical protein